MPKVEIQSNKTQVVPMGKIPQGKLAVIVESPVQGYAGRVVMGLPFGNTVCLMTGATWDSRADPNKCRILSPNEQLKLTNDLGYKVTALDLTKGQMAKVLDSPHREIIGNVILSAYGDVLVSLTTGETYSATSETEVQVLPVDYEVLLDNME